MHKTNLVLKLEPENYQSNFLFYDYVQFWYDIPTYKYFEKGEVLNEEAILRG